MICRIYADSLGLPRPGSTSPSQCYGSLMRSWYQAKTGTGTFDFHSCSKGGSTIADLHAWFLHDNFYFGQHGDVLIIHCGICDCAPRPVPPRIRRIITRLPSFISRHIIHFLHEHRAALLKRGFSWRNTSPDVFERIMKSWLALARGKFTRIYIVGIAPTNSSTESHSPGLSASIVEFNEIIRDCIQHCNSDSIVFIDAYTKMSESGLPIDEFILKEDGHHLTAKAHQAYFSWIRDKEVEYFPQSK